MKVLQLMPLFFLLTACTARQNGMNSQQSTTRVDTIVRHDTVVYNPNENWQSFGLTHDPAIDSVWHKPVQFYINNPKCSPIAIDFYEGQFRPTDNRTTEALLSLVTTDDAALRPFYRWCLEKTIQIQDGALAEYTGLPARKYAEQFPEEFFGYMDADPSRKRYDNWTGAINYSGVYDEDVNKDPRDVRARLVKKMNAGCRRCGQEMRERIRRFALDCFPQDAQE